MEDRAAPFYISVFFHLYIVSEIPWQCNKHSNGLLQHIELGCFVCRKNFYTDYILIYIKMNNANQHWLYLTITTNVKRWLIGKDSDAGRDWGEEEKGTTKDEMAGWHHWLDGRESEWTPGVGDGQGGLACCDSWGRKESDMTEQLNWTEAVKFY